MAVRNHSRRLRQSVPASVRSLSSTSFVSPGISSANAWRRMRRWTGVRLANNLPWATTTSGRGHSPTFAVRYPVRYLRSPAYRSPRSPLEAADPLLNPAEARDRRPTANHTGVAPSARTVSLATQDCCTPILSPA